jgi:hypothetical protein
MMASKFFELQNLFPMARFGHFGDDREQPGCAIRTDALNFQFVSAHLAVNDNVDLGICRVSGFEDLLLEGFEIAAMRLAEKISVAAA